MTDPLIILATIDRARRHPRSASAVTRGVDRGSPSVHSGSFFSLSATRAVPPSDPCPTAPSPTAEMHAALIPVHRRPTHASALST